MPNNNELPPDFKPGMEDFSAADLNRWKRATPREIRGAEGTDSARFGQRAVLGSNRQVNTNPREIRAFVVRGYGRITTNPDLEAESESPNYFDLLHCVAFNFLSEPHLFTSDFQSRQDSSPPIPMSEMIYVVLPPMLQRTPWQTSRVNQVYGVKNDGVDTPFVEKIVEEFTFEEDSHLRRIRSANFADGSIEYETISPPYLLGEIIYAVKGSTGYKWPTDPSGRSGVLVDISPDYKSGRIECSPVFFDNLIGRTAILSNGITILIKSQGGSTWVDIEAIEPGTLEGLSGTVSFSIKDEMVLWTDINTAGKSWRLIDTNKALRGVLNSRLEYGGSTTMRIWALSGSTGKDVLVYDWLFLPGQSINAGTLVTATWRGGRYVVDGSQCAG